MAFHPVQVEEIDVLVSFAIDQGLISADEGQAASDELIRAQALAAIELHGKKAGTLYPDLFTDRSLSRWEVGDLATVISIADAYWYATLGCAPWSGASARSLYALIRSRIAKLVKERQAEFTPDQVKLWAKRKWLMRMYTPRSFTMQSSDSVH